MECTEDLCCHISFALVVDVVSELAREGVLGELLYADDLIVMSETVMVLRNKFLKWKEAFVSEGLKASLQKTSDCQLMDYKELSKSKVFLCGVCSLRVKNNYVLYVQCSKWIHNFGEILLAGDVNGILIRLWSMKTMYFVLYVVGRQPTIQTHCIFVLYVVGRQPTMETHCILYYE